MSLKDQPGRGGCIVKLNPDGSAENRTLGFWGPEFDAFNGTSAIPRLRGMFGIGMGIAQKYHARNEARLIGASTRTEVLLPEASARAAEARRDQHELKQLEERIATIKATAFDTRLTLEKKIVDFGPSNNLGQLLHRQELRAHLAKMPDEQRLALIENRHNYRIAALSGEPELSGLSQPMHRHYLDSEVRNRFPDQVRELEATGEAVALVEQVIGTAGAAVENELVGAGSSVEMITPATGKAWA